jgi:acyl carrier protein
MANATEHLRQVAEQQYGVDASEAAALDGPALRDLLLSKIAQSKYNVSPSELEGTDSRGMITLLIQKMVTDLLKVDESKVTLDASFDDDLHADSLDMVELLMSIEDVFEPFGGIKIPEDDIDKIKTVGAAVDAVDNYINEYVTA